MLGKYILSIRYVEIVVFYPVSCQIKLKRQYIITLMPLEDTKRFNLLKREILLRLRSLFSITRPFLGSRVSLSDEIMQKETQEKF